ncbi:MAG: VCBS repeat-containing protein, partial [Caldilineaceae bacterium]|nr:VCBS repeat-containing protein [Caldilineaceae bacterium]
GDGDLDLATANAKLFEAGTRNDLYLNNGTSLATTPAWQSESTAQSVSLAWGDANGDGLQDLVFGNQGSPPELYLGSRPSAQEAGAAPTIAIDTAFAPAAFYADPAIHNALVITVPYTLSDPFGRGFSRVEGFYAINGTDWQPAVAAQSAQEPGAVNPCPLAGGAATFAWNVADTPFFGQSDHVMFRLQAYPCLAAAPHALAGSYAWASISTQSFPFRARGAQVRVVDEDGAPRQGALVFKKRSVEPVAQPMTDATGLRYQTDANGYLQGAGVLNNGDNLMAIWPSQYITTPFSARLFYMSAPLTKEGLAFERFVPGQTLTLTTTEDLPLVVFDLDISLEWDARNDLEFMRELDSAIKNASALLFDITNGQVALGEVHVYHNKEYWNQAHIVIYAANNIHPRATQGGIANELIADTVFGPDGAPRTIDDAYGAGQVRMGPLWDPFGLSQNELSTDWWRAL